MKPYALTLVTAVLVGAVLALGSVIHGPIAVAEEEGDGSDRLTRIAGAMESVKVDLTAAIRTAATKAGGTAVAAKIEIDDGAPVFEVFVLVAGERPRIAEVVVDARTGLVLETEFLGGEEEEERDDASDDDPSDDDSSDDDDASKDDDSSDDDGESKDDDSSDDDDDSKDDDDSSDDDDESKDDDSSDDDDESKDDDSEGDDGGEALDRLTRAMALVKFDLAAAVKVAAQKACGKAVAAHVDLEDTPPELEVLVLVGGEKPHLVGVVIDSQTGAVLEMEVLGEQDDSEGGDSEDDDDSDDDESEEDDDSGSEDDESEDED